MVAICEVPPEKKPKRTWTNLLHMVYRWGRCSPHRWSPGTLRKPLGGLRDCKSWVWREQRCFSHDWLAEVFSPPCLEFLPCWETRICLEGATSAKLLKFRTGQLSSSWPFTMKTIELGGNTALEYEHSTGQCPLLLLCTRSLHSFLYSLLQHLTHCKTTNTFQPLLLAHCNPNFSRCC